MVKIVANMIARNEADKYLPEVLERLSGQVHLICLTDDCSEDDTANVAESYGAKVYRMAAPTFSTHEGKLRQASWEFLESQITRTEPWWVLAIDADEKLYETRHELRALVDQDRFDVINIDFYHMWNPTQFRVDKAWRPHGSTRLFKYMEGGRFLDRQLACGAEPTYVPAIARMRSRYLTQSGLIMQHLSYIKDEDKKAKYDRYSSIDGGAFHANAHIESIMDPDPVLIDWTFG